VFLAQENNSSNMRPNAMWGQLQRQWKSQLSNDASTAQIKIGKQIKRKTKRMHNCITISNIKQQEQEP
jgi:hypothetical protein